MANKIKITKIGSLDYPKAFLQLEKPPPILSYIGHPVWNENSCISIVGSRETSPLSIRWMDRHLSPLAKKGFVFVSGGARGIDQAAHAISIRNRAPTIAFLPCGLAQCYPREFSEWIKPIVDAGGAVVSELEHEVPMQKHYFHLRNRLIVAMSEILLVVQANRRSGTMMSARLALDQQKTVVVVPGSPMESHWAGSMDLLFNGAFPVRDEHDIVSLAGLLCPRPAQKPNSENRKENIRSPNRHPGGKRP